MSGFEYRQAEEIRASLARRQGAALCHNLRSGASKKRKRP